MTTASPTQDPTAAAITAAMELAQLDPRRVIVPAVVDTNDIAAWFGCGKTSADKLLAKMRAKGLKTIGIRGRYFSADVRTFAQKIGT